jgi:hypothetical protein
VEIVLDLPVLRAPWRLRPAAPSRTDDLGIADVVAGIALGDSRPARLSVSRTADDDLHDRQVYLYLDGEDWATIYFGQTITKEIPPGRHVLKANNTLVRKSVEFDARPGEHVRFRCINRPHWTLMLFMAVLGAAIVTVVLERETDVVPAAKPDGPARG